jgi:hypothetical protein
MEQYVFVSYARDDRHFVGRLVQDLRARGIAVWQDVEQLAPGDNWERSLRDALLKASAVLFVANARNNASNWVVGELKALQARSIPVFPILPDERASYAMPEELQTIHWLDFSPSYEHGLEIITRLLERYKGAGQVKSEPKKSKGYVFISYAEEDTDFVTRLKEFLATKGYGYWDYAESDRDYHGDLFLELEGVITGAAGTLSVLSPHWKQSRTAIKELHFSSEVGIPVFLLKAREMGPTLAIAGIPYIDFTQNESAGYDKLDRELKRKGL